jgi:hypothetical protein
MVLYCFKVYAANIGIIENRILKIENYFNGGVE